MIDHSKVVTLSQQYLEDLNIRPIINLINHFMVTNSSALVG